MRRPKPKRVAPPSWQRPLFKIRVMGQRFAPHADLYYFILTRPWPVFILLVALGFVAMNALFALAYTAQPGSIANLKENSVEEAFYFSVQTMATIGYGGMLPATRYGHLLVTVEALFGAIGFAVVTGMTFAKFARPSARVLFSRCAVVGLRDGVPHLMFRMANWRHNQVVEAQLRVLVLVSETTAEGEAMRRQLDLSLVRDRTPLFSLTWTAMHRIEEGSLFHGEHAVERLRAAHAEVILSLTGLDESIGQTIHARHRYDVDEIVWGARFRDVLTVLPDGTREIDCRNFHEVLPLEPPQGSAPETS
ncbi:MAG: ATP-sensitive inward rectifier potassium channel 10 [Deltaproteobacteria bacterium]|nr:ATP-sensitive inward rectifier potassium channel 10 [Deltaproteobacteria bacterium]